MSQAAYTKKIRIKTTAQTTAQWAEIPGNAGALTLGRDQLDDTDFTSTGWRSRTVGLKEYGVTGTALYSTGNSALNTLRSAWLNATRLDFEYLPNGTKGFTGVVRCDTLSHSGDVAGLETVDISLASDGTPLTTV